MFIGVIFLGEYDKVLINGKGTFTNELGEKYEGEFAQGLYNGQGK